MPDKGLSAQQIMDFIILGAVIVGLLIAISREISKPDNQK